MRRGVVGGYKDIFPLRILRSLINSCSLRLQRGTISSQQRCFGLKILTFFPLHIFLFRDEVSIGSIALTELLLAGLFVLVFGLALSEF